MKKMKKLASLLLAVIMVMAMATTAFGAEANLDGHTYVAYQIFAGTQADGTQWLGNIAWGDGVNAEALLTELKTTDFSGGKVFADCTVDDVSGVADVVGTFTDGSADAYTFAEIVYKHRAGDGIEYTADKEFPAGYYLVVDTTEFAEGAENTVKNLALLQLTSDGTIDIVNKTDVPEVVKKVKEKNDSLYVEVEKDGETTKVIYTSEWQDAADYDINDAVPFQLTGTLPTDYDNYAQYKYVFHDTLSDGFTYNPNKTVVYLVDKDGNKIGEFVSGADYTYDATTNGFTITFEDLKKTTLKDSITKDSKIIVEYEATLNQNAVLGAVGNPNKVYLEYSNNPNQSSEGTPETGHTPEDTVIVFTYKLDVDKVEYELDEDGKKTGETQPLAGAEFTLYKYDPENANAITADSETATDDEKANYVGYVKLDMVVTDGTNFSFTGLDAGKYVLVESKTPAGYNTIDPITFEVVASYTTESDEPTLTGLIVESVSGDVISKAETETGDAAFVIDTGKTTISTTVVNERGGILPETGGAGTTIFYVVGAILVIGAGVVLVTKKRMSVNN